MSDATQHEAAEHWCTNRTTTSVFIVTQSCTKQWQERREVYSNEWDSNSFVCHEKLENTGENQDAVTVTLLAEAVTSEVYLEESI